MNRIGLFVVLSLVLGIGSCRFMVPERFAVNAPILAMLFGSTTAPPTQTKIRSRLHLPTGFSLALYADSLPNIRWMHFSDHGDLLISQPRAGKVLLLERDSDADGHPDGRRELLSDLNRPHGLELRDGWLYVAETDAIGRARFDANAGRITGEFKRIVTGLPAGGNHWSRTLGFGPDGWLYVSVGSSCNVCVEEDDRRAAILRFRPDGSEPEIFARGLRNAVGFDWHPSTNRLYATDNGRDLLGDNFPPCELNHVVAGGFYGWPISNGERVPDPDLGAGQAERIQASTPPAHAFAAHNAPLGISFLRGDWLPQEYREAALVALHGSWNRTKKDGYKVVSLHWGKDGHISERDFLTGFELRGDVIGRPVHVVEGPDEAIYISDDFSGSIWQIRHGQSDHSNGSLQGSDRGETSRAPEAPTAAQARTILRGQNLYEKHDCGRCHEPQNGTQATAALQKLGRRFTMADLIA